MLEEKVDLFYVTLTFHTLVFSGITTVFCVGQSRILQMTVKNKNDSRVRYFI